MVTIINGEIVQDNDPRAQEFRNRGRRQQEQQHQRTRGSQNQNYPPVQQGGSIFDQLNDRLISAGFPRWNLGQNVVEPIVSVALILALVLASKVCYWWAFSGSSCNKVDDELGVKFVKN